MKRVAAFWRSLVSRLGISEKRQVILGITLAGETILVALLILAELVFFPWAKHRGWTTRTKAYSTALTLAPDGSMWVAANDGITRFEGENRITYQGDGMPELYVRTIAVTSSGDVWVGFFGEGASRFDGEAWVTYTEKDGLADDHVFDIAVAADDSVWIGTYNGISHLNGEIWISYTENNCPVSGRVQHVATTSDGSVWFGTSYGVHRRLANGKWITYKDDGLIGNHVRAITVGPDDEVWVGTVTGAAVSSFDRGRWISHGRIPRSAAVIFHVIAVGHDGAVWLGTDGNGVLHFDGKTWKTYTTANSGLAGDTVNALAVDGLGRVWMGTNKGTCIFDEHTGLPVQGWLGVRSLLAGIAVLTPLILLEVVMTRSRVDLIASLAAGPVGAIAGFVTAPLGWIPMAILKDLLEPVLRDWTWGIWGPQPLATALFLPPIGALLGLFGGLIGYWVITIIYRYREDTSTVEHRGHRRAVVIALVVAFLCGLACGFMANLAMTPMAD